MEEIELETIKLTFEDGEEEEFFVMEKTSLMGANYYLVVQAEEFEKDDDEESDCYILKEQTDETDPTYGMYTFVEDQDELDAIFPIFEELLEDSDVEVEN